MKYKVNIKDANRKVHQLYDAEEIVLDSSDWQDTNIGEAEETEE